MKRTNIIRVGRYEITGEYEATDLGNGEWGISDAEWGRLELQASIALLSHAKTIVGEELQFIRKALGLRVSELATLLDTTDLYIERLEANEETIRRTMQMSLLLLVEHEADPKNRIDPDTKLTLVDVNKEQEFVPEVK